MNNWNNADWIKDAKEMYPGWSELIDNLDKLMSFVDPEYEILQVKEKFGSLRFYYKPSKDYAERTKGSFMVFCDPLNAFVKFTERLATITCEECGLTDFDLVKSDITKGKSSWIKTLCDSCREERYKDR